MAPVTGSGPGARGRVRVADGAGPGAGFIAGRGLSRVLGGGRCGGLRRIAGSSGRQVVEEAGAVRGPAEEVPSPSAEVVHQAMLRSDRKAQDVI